MIAVKIKGFLLALLCTFLIVACAFSSAAQTQTADNNTAQSDPTTWAAVDGLGRTLPDYADVGDTDGEKQVGVFYWTWHYNRASTHQPKNTREILDVYQNGDAAPGVRFAFVFDSKSVDGETDDNGKAEKSLLENIIDTVKKIRKFEICKSFEEIWFDWQFGR